MSSYIRTIGRDGVAVMTRYMDGMSALQLLAKAGITPASSEIVTVDGRGANTPVKPGSTIALQPMAFNG